MSVVGYIAYLACFFGVGMCGAAAIRRGIRGGSDWILLVGMAIALGCIGVAIKGLAL